MITVCSKIVVPFDGSELSKKALDTAITFLKSDENIELDVVMVVNVRTIVHEHGMSLVDIEELRQEYMASARKELSEIECMFTEVPNKIKTLALEGEPGIEIVEYSQENDIDLVVMGSRGLSGIKEKFLGSVSHHVVQKSSCPVMIVK